MFSLTIHKHPRTSRLGSFKISFHTSLTVQSYARQFEFDKSDNSSYSVLGFK